MILGVVIDLSVGLLCVILGLLLWRKQKNTILHDYHYRHVKKEDIPAYTRQMGIGLILLGVGVCITGVLSLLASSLWWIPLAAGFVLGIFTMHRAQMKFNGSWLS